MKRTRAADLGIGTGMQAREVAAKARRLARAAPGDVGERLSKLAKELESEADELDRKAAGGSDSKE